MDAQGCRKAVQETLPAGQVLIREKWLWEAAAMVVVLGPVAFVLL